MVKEIPSVGDLRRKSEVTDGEIWAAKDASLADADAEPFVFSRATGWTWLGLSAATTRFRQHQRRYCSARTIIRD
jgi:hypothetical protein